MILEHGFVNFWRRAPHDSDKKKTSHVTFLLFGDDFVDSDRYFPTFWSL